MKRLFIIITCLLLATGGGKVSAGGAGGGSLEVTQNLNRLLLLAQKASSASTAMNTQLLMIKTTIRDPIANKLIDIAIDAVSKNSLAWAQPLLPTNPEQYVKNEGLNAARKVIATLPQDGTYSSSIFSTLVNTYKDTGVGERIKQETQSTIPSIVQKNMCSEEKLSSLARERWTGSGGETDEASMQVEKEYLYGYACTCDPTEDADCSTKLLDLYKQRPDLGGGAALRALTSGDNEFAKSKMVESIVREEVEKKKEFATKDLFEGLGAVSEKKCLREETDLTGGTFCAESAVLNPGKAVQNIVNIASTAKIQRSFNLNGEGGLISMLSNMAEQSFIKGLNSKVAELTGGSSNFSVTTGSSVSKVADLANDPRTKNDLIAAMLNRIDELDKVAVDNLEKTDASYLSLVNKYENSINKVRGCFSDLIRDKVILDSDQRAVAAYSYYNQRKGRIDEVRAILETDATKIRVARDLITETPPKLKASDSSQEISSIYDAYSNAYTEQGLPTTDMASKRSEEMNDDESNVNNDNEGPKHLDSCAQAGGSTYSGF